MYIYSNFYLRWIWIGGCSELDTMHMGFWKADMGVSNSVFWMGIFSFQTLWCLTNDVCQKSRLSIFNRKWKKEKKNERCSSGTPPPVLMTRGRGCWLVLDEEFNSHLFIPFPSSPNCSSRNSLILKKKKKKNERH